METTTTNPNINAEMVEQETSLVSPQPDQEKKEEKNNDSVWKAVVIGGIPGIALGVAGTLGTEQAIAAVTEDVQGAETSESTQGTGSMPNPAGAVVPSEMHVATSVNDQMSFGQAFAAARHEVGAGGVFEWRGQLYSTYQKEEWDALSDEQRHEFGQIAAGVPVHGNSHPASTQDHVAETESGPNVEILSVETVQAEDGAVAQVAHGTIDGHAMAMADVDGDGEVDVAVVDINDNGVVEEDEIAVMENSGVRMSDLSEMAQDNLVAQGPDPVADHLYSGMPDYSNDANLDSLA